MNTHTVQVFLYELRRNLRRKGYLFTTFGIPLIAAALLFGYQFITSLNNDDGSQDAAQQLAQQLNFENVQHAGYVDLSGLFADPGDLSALLTRYPDEAAAQAALDNGAISLYYVIGQDYLETGDVLLVQPSLDISQIESAPIQRLVLNTLSEGVDPQIVMRLINPANLQTTNLALVGAENGPQNEDTSFIVVYIFAVALMLGLFTTNGYLMQSVIEEKETRLIEILISTVRPGQLLAGKILALGLVGLLQLVVWIGSILLIVRLAGGETFGATVGALATIASIQIPTGIIPTLLIYFVLAYFLFAGLYSIVGALSNSLREGPQYAVIFTLPAALPLYFLSLFTSAPDGPIPTILSLIPITAPIAMAQRLVISNVPLWQLLVSLALLAVTAIGVMWAAGRVFRVQVLLAGQMPRLKDLPRLLRG
ncbi:MAG: ABC transporter permease [Anaerolineae bacterium]|nr:ABC transporter permease [Anaerolineae bacterium]